MKNPFDRQIRDAFIDNLEDIKASDDLIMRTLNRIKEEENTSSPSTKLTAINMGYIRKHENHQANRASVVRKIVLTGIMLASASLLVINLAGFLKSSDSTSNSEPQLQVLEANAVANEPDYSEYIHVSTPKATRSYVSNAYNANYDHGAKKNNKSPLLDRTL